jgi:hypothetical protein
MKTACALVALIADTAKTANMAILRRMDWFAPLRGNKGKRLPCSAHLPPPSVSSRCFEQLRHFWPNRRKLRRFPILAQLAIMSCVILLPRIRWNREILPSGCERCQQSSRPTGASPDSHRIGREPIGTIGYFLRTRDSSLRSLARSSSFEVRSARRRGKVLYLCLVSLFS